MKHFLRHLFLPHPTNNHRAKILHHGSILSLVVVLLISNFSFSLVENRFHDVLGISANISSDELLLHTNIKRQENGLPPLVINNQLSQAAAGKAQDMMTKNYWAHIAPDGTTPWAFFKGAGYEYVHAGENLARGFTTSNDVIEAWMASPGHRENMLSPNYNEVGFAILSGVLTGEDTVLVVEMLGSRSSVAQNAEVSQEVAIAPTATPTPIILATPTPFIVQQVLPTPTPTSPPVPTLTPTPLPLDQGPTIRVAAVRSEPLVDRSSLNKSISLLILGLLLTVLLTDMVIIKRKRIMRILNHHLDQIIFYGILLVIILVIGQGSIL